MNNKNWIIGGVFAVIALAILFTMIGSSRDTWIPKPDYETVYRLVPEKVSRSAAITVAVPISLPETIDTIGAHVSFNPSISGHWVKEKDISFVGVAHAAENSQNFYFQPNQPLEVNRHYAVTVSASDNKTLTADFLVVADPEILSILPANDEVLANTKISIVFNRPMVPLSSIDEMSQQALPISITPATPGKFKWISTHTLQFIPDRELISSADYSVTVSAGFKSMEGLPVKPKSAVFSTYHMRYAADINEQRSYKQNVVRGYNQPFLVQFNQPVDLDNTSKSITVSNGTKNIPFTAKYWKKPKSDVDEIGEEGGALGAVYKAILNSAAVASSKDDEEDLSMLAIYPEGGENGNWEPGTIHVVTIGKAFPKSGGNITTEQKSFQFSVDDIVAGEEVISSRTSQSSIGSFDPTGQLQITFYENINLSKSRISAPGLADVVYAEKCRVSSGGNCVKESDHKKILISFKKNEFALGDKIPVKLEKIISDNDRLLTSEPLVLQLKVYEALVIFKVTSGDNLNNVIVCSNNPIAPKKDGDGQVTTFSPGVENTSWQYSYISNSYSNLLCSEGTYATAMKTNLLPDTRYSGIVKLVDVFGSAASKQVDFQSRSLRSGDYALKTYQEFDTVTIPSKTKLTFSAAFLPNITVTVCKMGSYNFYKARNAQDEKNVTYPCQSSVSRVIDLPTNKPEQVFFSVDIKDYFPNPIGNYLVTLSSPYIPANSSRWQYPTRTLVSVTNLIVTEKKIAPITENGYESLTLTGDQLSKLQNMYWVINATTREPVVGATVSIYRQGSIVSSATTNSQGVTFLVPVVGEEAAVATYGGDSVVVSGYDSNVTYASQAANIQHLYLYTDKPLYRPGQQINIKGIYRYGYDGYYEVPVRQTVTLNIYNSANEVIQEQKLPTNAYGTVAATFTLNTETPLGSYRACIEYNCTYFDVLNYVPAAFQVTFDDTVKEFLGNDQPKLKLKANYYFGVPLSNASVSYNLSSQYYYFEKYTGGGYFSFNNLYRDDLGSRNYYYGDRYLGNGTANLDEKGEVSLVPDLKQAKLDADTSKIIILDATIKNQQGRSIGAQKSFILHAAPIYIGSQIDHSFAPAGQTLGLKLKTVDTEGKPVSLGSIKAEIYRVKWVSNKHDSSENAYTTWTRERELIKTEQTRTDHNGDASVSVVSPGEGEYEVDVTSSQKGVAVGSRSWFYSYGKGAVEVRSTTDTYLNIVSRTNNVKPGQTAEVVFEVPEGSAKALVTIERGKIFSYEIIDVTGSIAHYQFPVTAAHYPNIYVSVVAYPPGHEVRAGTKSFVVDSDQKKIKLSVTSDRPVYNPGDTVKLSISATDDGGVPLSSEVSVAVVDMSVLALRGNPKKDPITEFYGHVPLTVGTYTNFKNLLKYETPSSADGKCGSGGDPNSQKRRGVFKEVAYWKPNVQTDATGHATVTFVLPDNLTTWQAEAVAVTTDTKVGAAYHEFTTNKTLMVTPLKPRFVLPGDSFMMGATVFNRTATTFDGTVGLKIPSLELSKDTTQNVSIKANESKTLYWDVRVPFTSKPGVVGYSIDATGSGLSDAVDDVLPIRSNTSYETVATAGQTESSTNEYVYLPNTIGTGQGQLTLHTSATLAVFLSDALNYFVTYPYGCTEQISSQLRGIVLIKRAYTIPNVPNPIANQKVVYRDAEYTVDQVIKQGLDTLYARQNVDGGFSFWSGDRTSSYWTTLQAVDAFRTLSESGVAIDDVRWKKAADYLYNQYISTATRVTNEGIIELASALFSRTEYRNNGQLLQVLDTVVRQFSSDRKTPISSILATSRLLHRYNISLDKARQLDQVLKNKVVIDARGSFLDISTEGGYADNALSNTANYIELLSLRKEKDPQLPDLLRWVIASRKKDGAWGTTQNTLFVVSAFTKYLEWQPETSANFEFKGSVNGKNVQEFSFNPKTVFNSVSTSVPLSDLNSGTLNTVGFAKTDSNSKGKIYYDMSLKYYLPANELPPRDEGMTIKRGMYTLTDTKGETLIKGTKVGEVVREHLEVTVPVTRRNVLIEDFIPAGMEIIDTSLSTEDKSVTLVAKEVKSSRLWPTHKELRDDRYVLVIDELPPGTYQFDYFLRALTPGTYTHLPAQASEFYNPENFGRTGSELFTVEK